MPVSPLSPVMYWPMTPIVHQVAMNAMDNRARVEVDQVKQGIDIADVHGEVAKTLPFLRKLIFGAAGYSKRLGFPITGTGADLGSGTGGGACIVSQIAEVGQVYAVECSHAFVEEIMPEVFRFYHAAQEKIQRVVGDFNALRLDSSSLDFMVEIASFHHSEDLAVTSRECYRVLKPGGVIIAIERAWPDETPQIELEAKLDKEFSPLLKHKYGIPENQPFTRRDWGEHEYTVQQWEKTFQGSGFQTVALIQGPAHLPGANFILTRLPAYDLSLRLAGLFPPKGNHRVSVYGWQKQEVVFIFIKKAG